MKMMSSLIFTVVYSNRRIRNGLTALQRGILGPLGHLALSRENVTVPYLSHVFGSFGNVQLLRKAVEQVRVVSSTQANTRQWCMFNILTSSWNFISNLLPGIRIVSWAIICLPLGSYFWLG